MFAYSNESNKLQTDFLSYGFIKHVLYNNRLAHLLNYTMFFFFNHHLQLVVNSLIQRKRKQKNIFSHDISTNQINVVVFQNANRSINYEITYPVVELLVANPQNYIYYFELIIVEDKILCLKPRRPLLLGLRDLILFFNLRYEILTYHA